jgi:hypothetical protein
MVGRNASEMGLYSDRRIYGTRLVNEIYNEKKEEGGGGYVKCASFHVQINFMYSLHQK